MELGEGGGRITETLGLELSGIGGGLGGLITRVLRADLPKVLLDVLARRNVPASDNHCQGRTLEQRLREFFKPLWPSGRKKDDLSSSSSSSSSSMSGSNGL